MQFFEKIMRSGARLCEPSLKPHHCGGSAVIEIYLPTSSFPAYPDPNPVSIAFAGDIKKIGGAATLEIVFHANPEPKEFRSF